jgi:AraC-like DNA-binding protein
VLAGLTTFQVGDPHRTSAVVWERLPVSERLRLNRDEVMSRTYEAADWGRFKDEPKSYCSTFSIGHCGALRLARIADTRGTGFNIGEPGLDAVCVSIMDRGSSMLTRPESRDATVCDGISGIVFSGAPASRLVTRDDSVRLQLWVPGGLLRRALGRVLERPVAETLEFAPVGWSRGSGTSVSRLIRYLFAEMSEGDSLLSSGIGAGEFEALIVQSLLLGLPHNFSAQLERHTAAAAPKNVRRAEEFLHAHADQTLDIEKIAQAAGCGVRALQLAFRQFRNTTPMQALRRLRLDLARAELARPDGPQTVIDVAAKFAFANPGRFAKDYARTFGEYPSEVLQKRLRR